MTAQSKAILLNDRGLIKLEGADCKSFLQAIITNDINLLNPANPIYAAILTPQGKYLFDFIITENSDTSLYLDCELERIDELIKKLTMYKLRADVSITNISEQFNIWAIFGAKLGFSDPRHNDLGHRLYLVKADKPVLKIGENDEYDQLRLSLNIPQGGKDIEVDKRPILEANFEALNGVSFTKGCYVGQEVTARMKYRNAVRKHIYPVKFESPAPEFGTLIYHDGKKIGHMLSSKHGLGLALIKDDILEKTKCFDADGKTIEIYKA